MVPEINYLAVLLAGLSSMAVGFVFYHRAVMGTRWMRLVGHTDESVQGGSPLVYPVVLLASLVTAWVLAGAGFIAHDFYGGSFLVDVLVTAWIIWLGFTAARLLVHDLFDTRPTALSLITSLHELLTITAMGLIIGLLPPGGV